MKEPTQKCMDHLEGLRKNWLTANENFQIKDVTDNLSQANMHIDGIEYTENVYAEKSYEDRTLIIFELRRPTFIGSTHHCLGIAIEKDQSKVLLSQEDLWDLGIP